MSSQIARRLSKRFDLRSRGAVGGGSELRRQVVELRKGAVGVDLPEVPGHGERELV